jgi:hypothetical protein
MNNIPYVKQYDENGILIPLTENYINFHPNRQTRRKYNYQGRELTNRKPCSRTGNRRVYVFKELKYFKVVQTIVNKFNVVLKTIIHTVNK